jgi:hypothetical protein
MKLESFGLGFARFLCAYVVTLPVGALLILSDPHLDPFRPEVNVSAAVAFLVGSTLTSILLAAICGVGME